MCTAAEDRFLPETWAQVFLPWLQAADMVTLPPPPAARAWARPTDGLTVLCPRPGRDLPDVNVLRWGLIPDKDWTPALARRYLNTNARAETLLDTRSFAPAMTAGHRCIVPLSAFYEWRAEFGKKVKYRVSRRDGKPLLIAGLFNPDGRLDGVPTPSCTVVTRPANADVQFLHGRMPALLLAADARTWLDAAAAPGTAQALATQPYPWGVLRLERAD